LANTTSDGPLIPFGIACQKAAPDPLRAACAAGNVPERCARCPNFTGFAGGENGVVTMVRHGSFSGPYPEAIVRLNGCEGHVANWGGMLLVRQVSDGWVPITYLPGVVPLSCDVVSDAANVSRLACQEHYGLNSGTYLSGATVIDFRTRRVDSLISGMCEDGRDVEAVRWVGVGQQSVEVTVSFGLLRDNDGQRCFDRSGKKRHAVLTYVEEGSAFQPSDAARNKLLAMVPAPRANEALDPAVRAAVQYKPKVPKDLLPEPHETHFVDPECPNPKSQ
jgi:hypothetical protein